MVTKEDLRKQFRQRLNAWNSSESIVSTPIAADGSRSQADLSRRQAAEVRLTQHLIDELKGRTGRWGAYISLPSEPNPSLAIQQLSRIRWAFPLTDGAQMRFLIPRENARFLLGLHGVSEPDPLSADEVLLSDLEGILVPGVAFDRKGGRLGRGKGYFDRALSEFKGEKIGIAFSVQVSDESLPMDAWDVPMDAIVTENGVFRI